MKKLISFFYINGKINFARIILTGILFHIILAIVLFFAIRHFSSDGLKKTHSINLQIKNNPDVIKNIGSYCSHKMCWELIDKEYTDTPNQVHEIRQISGGEFAVIEFWYKDIKPDYKFDSLKILTTSDKYIRNTYKYEFNDE